MSDSPSVDVSASSTEAWSGLSDTELVTQLASVRTRLLQQIGRRVVGQESVVEHLLIALFAGGHGLFVGVPGLAKTLLISTLSEALELSFGRIQFTPDLMPSDITGTDLIEEDPASGRRAFRFVPGPLFANVVLADEINRTPPKTQAALLQSMAEHKVTVGGRTYPLPSPYLVFATQNPIEQEGTYALPEAQLDRFMFLIDVGYPTAAEEFEIVRMTTAGAPPAVDKVLGPEQIRQMQGLVRRIPVADHVVKAAVEWVRRTRPQEAGAPPEVSRYVQWGAGPRASQALVLAAKARAALQGRLIASVDDVRAVAVPVLRHRIVTNYHAEADGMSALKILEIVLK